MANTRQQTVWSHSILNFYFDPIQETVVGVNYLQEQLYILNEATIKILKINSLVWTMLNPNPIHRAKVYQLATGIEI